MTLATSTTTPAHSRRARWAALAAVGLAGVLAVGLLVARDRRRVESLAETARQAVLVRDWKAAEERIDAWIAARPQSGEAHFLLGRVLLATDRPREALVALERSLERGYPRRGPVSLRAAMQAHAGEVAEAEPVLVQSLAESDEPQPEVAEALAKVYLGTFRLREARAVIDRWMRDDPTSAKPYVARNEVDQRSDAPAATLVRNDREALRRDPGLDKSRLTLAEHLRAAHRADEAAEAFDAYIARKPEDPAGLVGAGQNAMERGRLAEAVKYFDAALAVDPRDPPALKERANIDFRAGRFEQARDRFAAVVALDPYDPDVRYSFGQTLKALKLPELAKAQEEAFQRLKAEHARMAQVRSALVRDPKDPALRLEAARWLIAHGHDEGVDWAQQLLADRPADVGALSVLAEYYERKQDFGKANYYRLALSGLSVK